jgi:hypothetical protein
MLVWEVGLSVFTRKILLWLAEERETSIISPKYFSKFS